MRKTLTLLIALTCYTGMFAQNYYLVGDGTVIGWEGNEANRQLTKLEKISEGVYQYTGLLKNGGEGFKICKDGSWDGFHPSVEKYQLSGTGTDHYTTTGNDWKWNPVNTDWVLYTVTLNTNEGTLSWGPADFTPLTAVDGVYTISTPEDLYKLAAMTRYKKVDGDTKVRLANDIDYTAYTNGNLSSIGLHESCPFYGEFDGQNHTIKVNLTSYAQRFSLFGTVKDGTIKNLRLEGSITAATSNQTGGIVGNLNNGTVKNCVSAVNIIDNQSGDGTIGGICAVGNLGCKVLNSAFVGSIQAPNREGNGGIVGWSNSNTSMSINNCLVITDNIDWAAGENIGRNNPSISNCIVTTSTDTDLASGMIAYRLNESISGGTNWYQTLGVDAMPTPLSTSKVVYMNGTFYCDGKTPKEGAEAVPSNTDGAVIDPHVFGTDEVCSGCHEVGVAPGKVDGVYQLNTAGNLLEFAKIVNSGETDAKAELFGDADLSETAFKPIGNEGNVFKGTFNGNFHSVTLGINEPESNYQGLFGCATDGAEISNVIVKGSIVGNNYVGGIVGGSSGGVVDKTLKIVGCGNEASVKANGANGAGIIGVNMSGSAHFYIDGCYTTGQITSKKEGGHITAWTGGDKSTVKNSYSISEAFNTGDNKVCTDFVRGGGNLVNWHMLGAADDDVLNGKLCYKLTEGGGQFRQTIGEDKYPTFNPSSKEVYGIAVGETGYATYIAPAGIPAFPTGITAYAVTSVDASVAHLDEVTQMQGGEAVVVNAAAGTYCFNGGDDAESANSQLTGDNNNDTTADGTQYILANGDNGIGFYQATPGSTIKAGKAYLSIQAGAGAKAFYGIDNETAIKAIEATDVQNAAIIYNMAGQRVGKATKGLYIVNGKKVALK